MLATTIQHDRQQHAVEVHEHWTIEIQRSSLDPNRGQDYKRT